MEVSRRHKISDPLVFVRVHSWFIQGVGKGEVAQAFSSGIRIA